VIHVNPLAFLDLNFTVWGYNRFYGQANQDLKTRHGII
jgi:hypothetical protein